MMKRHCFLGCLLLSLAVPTLASGQEIGGAGAANQAPAPNSANGGILGDPRNGVEQLTRIYALIQKYRALHGGAFAPSSLSLIPSIYMKPQDYGFASMTDAVKALSSPDDQYDDWASDFKQATANTESSYVPIAVATSRRDGSPLGGPKIQGTHDVLATVSTYQHENYGSVLKYRPANPVGFHLTLRDDGSIVRVPFDEVLFLPSSPTANADTGIRKAFPGQAGVLWYCLTYAERSILDKPGTFPPIGTRVRTNDVGEMMPFPDNGGIESLVILSRLLNAPLDRPDVWKSFDEAQQQFSLEDTRQAAAKLKVPLEIKTLSLDELQKLRAPAIFRASDDSRLVVLSQMDDKEAIVIDRGVTYILPRGLLNYSGQALVAASALAPADKSPQVLAEDAVRSVAFATPEEAVAQSVKITNTGAAPLTLQIERAIPGCEKAELSADTIAPGASATLSLTLRWRSILKTPTQNVLVFLDTNDPKRPRLPLSFRLSLLQAQVPAMP